jgi:hypothetical protein
MMPNQRSGSWFPLSAQISKKNGPQLAGLLGGMELGPLGVALGEGHRENLAIAGMFLSFSKERVCRSTARPRLETSSWKDFTTP